MDELGIAFEYEKEGFELPSGRYLPDLWLPLSDCPPEYPGAGSWFEVKGKEPLESELIKLRELSIITKHSAILVCGPPWDFTSWEAHNSGSLQKVDNTNPTNGL